MAISIRVSEPAASPRGVGLPVVRRPAGPWWRAARRLRRNRLAMISAAFLGGVVVIAFGAPAVVAIDPYQQNLQNALLPPTTAGHLFGTDQFGRDLVLRLVDGSRVSLVAGLIAVAIA